MQQMYAQAHKALEMRQMMLKMVSRRQSVMNKKENTKLTSYAEIKMIELADP